MTDRIERVAEVYWAQTNEGRGLVVRAGGAEDAGIAIVILCQVILAEPGLQEAHAPAQALVKALMGGKGWPKNKPIEIYRGAKEGSGD